MKFRFDEDNMDERFAGQTFPAKYGFWNPAADEWVPGEDERGEAPTLLVYGPHGWKPLFHPKGFGELVE